MAHSPDDGRRTKATSERNSDPRDHATPQAGANTERSADATPSPLMQFPCAARAELGLPEDFASSREVDLIDPPVSSSRRCSEGGDLPLS